MWQQKSPLKSLLIKVFQGQQLIKGKETNNTYSMVSGNLVHIRPLNRELIHKNITEQNADRKYIALLNMVKP